MREDWALIDFARAFMPKWLGKATSLTAVGAVALALLILIVALKAGR